MSEIKVVFFDVDDTLYDHSYHIHQAITAVRKEYSFLQEYSVEYLMGLSHEFLEEVHERLLRGEISVEESRKIRWQKFLDVFGRHDLDVMTLANFYSRSYYQAERAVPGAIELLKSLKQAYKLGVISNNLLAEQLSKMHRIGISEHFDTFAISEEVGAAKPDRKIFEVALARAEAESENSVMIGDSWNNDVLGAINVGIRPIWFNRSNLPSPDSRIKEISSFSPITDIIDHIRSDSPTPQITKADPSNI